MSQRYGSLQEKIAAETKARRERYIQFAASLANAWQAGLDAGQRAIPTPMVVYEADVITGQKPLGGKEWYVPEGACGFAWVTITPGNSSFAKWLVKNNHARKAYGGGVQIWISNFNQSIARKEACANAMAKVLCEELGVKAYAGSRLD